MITQALARELLDYSPAAGTLVWRRRARRWFKTDRDHSRWNNRFAGRPAGSLRKKVRCRVLVVALFDRQYIAHRIIWLWMTGRWPTCQIDHENRKSADNRWCNLREATAQINGRNRSMACNNTSGSNGVCWHIRKKKWLASIKVSDHRVHLGYFVDLKQAIEARALAERQFDFTSGHGCPREPGE